MTVNSPQEAPGSSSDSGPPRTNHDRLVAGTTGLVGLAVIVFLTRYNYVGQSILGSATRGFDEFLLVNVALLMLPPCLHVLWILRENLSGFGMQTPAPGSARIAVLLYLAMLPVVLVASRYQVFFNFYPLHRWAAHGWSALIAFEVIYGFYMFCWEFFYRGYLTLGLARGIGAPAAVALQAVAFGIMHIGKPMPEVWGSFAAGAILGVLAIRARSFLPCFALHWAVSATMDLLCIHARPGALF